MDTRNTQFNIPIQSINNNNIEIAEEKEKEKICYLGNRAGVTTGVVQFRQGTAGRLAARTPQLKPKHCCREFQKRGWGKSTDSE